MFEHFNHRQLGADVRAISAQIKALKRVLRARWLRDGLVVRLGLGIFFVAAAVSEAVLVAAAFGMSPPGGLPGFLLGTAVLMAAAVLLLLIAFLLPVSRLRPISPP